MDPDKDWYSSAPQEEPDERDDESELDLIVAEIAGEDGPETYAWDEGIAP